MKKGLKILLLIVAILVAVVLGFFWNDSVSDKYDVSIEDSKIPKFAAADLSFTHKYNKEKSLPIAP